MRVIFFISASVAVTAGFVFAFAGCGSSTTASAPYTGAPAGSYDFTTSQVVSAAVAQAASASDSGGSVVSRGDGLQRAPWGKKLWRGFSRAILPEALAGACTVSAAVAGQSCTGAPAEDMSIALGGCTGEFGTWTGTASLAFSSAAACTAASTGGLVSMGASNSMTLTSTAGLTLTTSAGSYVVEEDSSSSGYATAESGGIEVTCGAVSCSTSRTVQILGLHRAFHNSSGTELYDHTLNTTTSLTITGTGSSKQITAGVIQLQHNLSQYIATSTITSTLTFSANCCVPTGGTISTTFSGSKTGSESLTFTSSCGVGKVNNSTSISLGYCE